MKNEPQRLNAKKVMVNASITHGKRPRMKFIFVKNDKLQKDSLTNSLRESFEPLRLLNESLLSAQIVRGRNRHLSTVLIRGPFAVML